MSEALSFQTLYKQTVMQALKLHYTHSNSIHRNSATLRVQSLGWTPGTWCLWWLKSNREMSEGEEGDAP